MRALHFQSLGITSRVAQPPPPPHLTPPHPPPAEEEALKALEAFPGVSIINDRANNRFPTPLDASTKAGVWGVGWGGASPVVLLSICLLVKQCAARAPRGHALCAHRCSPAPPGSRGARHRQRPGCGLAAVAALPKPGTGSRVLSRLAPPALAGAQKCSCLRPRCCPCDSNPAPPHTHTHTYTRTPGLQDDVYVLPLAGP